MVSYAKLCCDFPNHHHSVLSDEQVNFLLTAFCDTSQLIIVWLTDDVHISIFEVLTHLLTLLEPMQACPYI